MVTITGCLVMLAVLACSSDANITSTGDEKLELERALSDSEVLPNFIDLFMKSMRNLPATAMKTYFKKMLILLANNIGRSFNTDGSIVMAPVLGTGVIVIILGIVAAIVWGIVYASYWKKYGNGGYGGNGNYPGLRNGYNGVSGYNPYNRYYRKSLGVEDTSIEEPPTREQNQVLESISQYGGRYRQ